MNSNSSAARWIDSVLQQNYWLRVIEKSFAVQRAGQQELVFPIFAEM
jgi:hypothetical protein